MAEYDAFGNVAGYVTGDANRLMSDGTYNYKYDDEGHTSVRTEIATGNFREFHWDHRSRLCAVVDKLANRAATQEVHFTYDTLDRRIAKSVAATPQGGVLTRHPSRICTLIKLSPLLAMMALFSTWPMTVTTLQCPLRILPDGSRFVLDFHSTLDAFNPVVIRID